MTFLQVLVLVADLSKDLLDKQCPGFQGHPVWHGSIGNLLHPITFAIFRDIRINRMSPCWILLELGMMEMVARAGAIRRAKLQSSNRRQQTNTQPIYYRPDALPVAQPTVSEH